jgi:uncharacterized membrane protein
MSSNKWLKGVISAILALGLGMGASASLAASKTPDKKEDAASGNGTKDKDELEKCYGVAKKGMNDCGAYDHSCQGEAETNGDPNEWILLPKGTCEKIVGGSLKPKDDKHK